MAENEQQFGYAAGAEATEDRRRHGEKQGDESCANGWYMRRERRALETRRVVDHGVDVVVVVHERDGIAQRRRERVGRRPVLREAHDVARREGVPAQADERQGKNDPDWDET